VDSLVATSSERRCLEQTHEPVAQRRSRSSLVNLRVLRGKRVWGSIYCLGVLLYATNAWAADWVEIGVDTEATYYVDVSSIEVEGDTVRVLKKGVFPQPLKEELGGAQKIFTQTLGIIELDCGRRINRVVQIDMLGSEGDVVWSSGRMSRRMWEDVRPHTHGEATLDFVCGRLGRQ